MGLDHVTDDGEAEPRAARLGARDPVELLEQARLVLGRDARPVILHLDAHAASDAHRPHHDRPPRRPVPDGVGR